MLVIPIKGQTRIYPGQDIDIILENGETEVSCLGPGRELKEEDVEICYIEGSTYLLYNGESKSKKEIPLSPSRIKCFKENGFVFPILREAKHREKNYFKIWEQDSVFDRKKLIGPECAEWPVIE